MNSGLKDGYNAYIQTRREMIQALSQEQESVTSRGKAWAECTEHWLTVLDSHNRRDPQGDTAEELEFKLDGTTAEDMQELGYETATMESTAITVEMIPEHADRATVFVYADGSKLRARGEGFTTELVK